MLYIKPQSSLESLTISEKDIRVIDAYKDKYKYFIVSDNEIVGIYSSEEKARAAFDGLKDALSKNQSIYVMPNDE